MKQHVILLLSLIVILFFSCYESDNTNSYKGHFYWKGTIRGTNITWTVSCRNWCGDCTADGTGPGGTSYHYELDRAKYPEVFKKCESLPGSQPEEADPVDTTKHEPIPTGKASIYKTADCKFGYDSWEDHNDADKSVYLSIATCDSTTFGINLDSNLINGSMYDSVVLTIPAGNGLSFSKNNSVLRLKLSQIQNSIKLYTGTTPLSPPIDISLNGIKDSSEPACLIGYAYGAEERLQVVTYDEKLYDDYLLYHYSGFAQNNEMWKSEFNKILKQGVIKMGDQDREEFTDDWDFNGNGIIDIFPGYSLLDTIKSGSPIIDELYLLLKEKGQFTEGCYDATSNDKDAHFVINRPMRQHWLLAETPTPDHDGLVRKLKLDKYTDIPLMDSVRIGPLFSTTNHYRITILGFDLNNNAILIGMTDSLKQGLPDVFSADSDITIYTTTAASGITADNCTFSREGFGWDTHVHEFLHKNNVGRLLHVMVGADITTGDNIMYPTKQGRTGTKLNYRPLTLFDDASKYQTQWDDLH